MAIASRAEPSRRGEGPPSRVVIEGVRPEIDAGRFPIKRTAGEEVEVLADIFAEGHDMLAAGSAATGMYRGLKLWAAAVTEAKSVSRDPVAEALDHAKITEAPGGPAEMVPGKRHCRMKMYIGVAKGGKYEIAWKSDGLLDPKEC